MPVKFEKIEQTIVEKRDKLLIKATLNGDSRSFAILFSLYKKRISALGMSFFKNEVDTDDFVQEVFAKIYTSLSQFKGDSLFSTWITRIAYNMAVNSVNRRKTYAPLANEEKIVAKNSTPEEEQIKKITIDAVREAIKELPENYTICIELYFFYDNSYEEICKITGLPINTVKSNIFRAKKILREKLKVLYEK